MIVIGPPVAIRNKKIAANFIKDVLLQGSMMVPKLVYKCSRTVMKKCFRFQASCLACGSLEVSSSPMLLSATQEEIRADRSKGPLKQATGDFIMTRTNAKV